jgi:hypothetical protein
MERLALVVPTGPLGLHVSLDSQPGGDARNAIGGMLAGKRPVREATSDESC